MDGVLLAFVTTLSWTIGIFPFTKASQIFGANEVNHFRLLLSVIILSFLIILFFNLNITQLNFHQWFWLGLSGVIGLSIGDYLSFSAFVYLGPGMGSVFSTLSPGAALISGIILLDEHLNSFGIVGMFITLIGVYIILDANKKEKTRLQNQNLKKGFFFGFLSALCQGVGIVFAKKGLVDSSNLIPIHATWIRMLGATVTMYAFTILSGNLLKITKPVLENKNNGLKYLFMGTLFGPVIGVTLSLYTVKLLEASIAQTIFSLVPVFVILISAIFYQNKIGLKTYLGLITALSGVFILVWRNYL